MGSTFRQIGAVVMMNLRSIPGRAPLSISTILSVGLVVGVLLGFLAMADGFRRTGAATGSDDVAILLRSGAESELNSTITRDQARIVETLPGIAQDDEGRPLVSSELYVVVDGIKRSSNTEVNLPFRGVEQAAVELRRGFEFVEGRMFTPGTNELIVGRAVQEEFAGFEYGSTAHLGGIDWQVVGVFTIPGSVFDTEVWGDLGSVQNLFRRGPTVQTMRVGLTSPDALEELIAGLADDPQVSQLEAESEAGYYAEQTAPTSQFIAMVGWPLAILMALGALAGALNTMYSSVEARTREIATLRAIGFGGFPAFVGTMAESLVLSAIGGVVGAIATYLVFDGFTASTLGAGFTQIVFNFNVGGQTIVTGIVLALIVGLVGGFFPAIRAARAPLLAVHRD